MKPQHVSAILQYVSQETGFRKKWRLQLELDSARGRTECLLGPTLKESLVSHDSEGGSNVTILIGIDKSETITWVFLVNSGLVSSALDITELQNYFFLLGCTSRARPIR